MYTLTLTEQDCKAIDLAGDRYFWSSILEEMFGPWLGDHHIQESDAWILLGAFETDTIGGHQYFPMLAHDSELAGKLFRLMDEIV